MNKINTERVVSIVGFLFLLCAGTCSMFLGGHPKSIIEYIAPTKIVIPIVHYVCCLVTFITIFKPNYFFMVLVLIVESILTILTDYETLGILFFYGAITLIIINDIFEQKQKPVVVVLSIIHFISLMGSCAVSGYLRALIDIASSAFFFTFGFWLFRLLKEQFSCFIPKNVTYNQVLSGLKQGQVLTLSQYGLSDRQKLFVLDNIHNNLSYKQISEKHFVSISTVKKEFSEIYKVFCVDKLEELRILLLQYQVEA